MCPACLTAATAAALTATGTTSVAGLIAFFGKEAVPLQDQTRTP